MVKRLYRGEEGERDRRRGECRCESAGGVSKLVASAPFRWFSGTPRKPGMFEKDAAQLVVCVDACCGDCAGPTQLIATLSCSTGTEQTPAEPVVLVFPADARGEAVGERGMQAGVRQKCVQRASRTSPMADPGGPNATAARAAIGRTRGSAVASLAEGESQSSALAADDSRRSPAVE